MRRSLASSIYYFLLNNAWYNTPLVYNIVFYVPQRKNIISREKPIISELAWFGIKDSNAYSQLTYKLLPLKHRDDCFYSQGLIWTDMNFHNPTRYVVRKYKPRFYAQNWLFGHKRFQHWKMFILLNSHLFCWQESSLDRQRLPPNYTGISQIWPEVLLTYLVRHRINAANNGLCCSIVAYLVYVYNILGILVLNFANQGAMV